MKKKFFSAALAAAMVVTSVFSTTSVAGAAENETAVPYGKVTVERKIILLQSETMPSKEHFQQRTKNCSRLKL